MTAVAKQPHTRKPRRRARAPRPPLDPGLAGTPVQRARDAVLLASGYRFDVAAADRVCAHFSENLKHSKGEWAGRPFVLAEWQAAPLRRLFGWKRPDGTRRYRKTYWRIPRKNGKSTLAAGVALYLMAGDGEEGAEVFGAANDKDQARIVFKEACNMVKASPELDEIAQVFRTAILVPQTVSSYQALSSESGNKDGLNIHGLVVDELHEWEDRDLWEKLTTAQGSRRQPMTAIFTTAGHDPNSLWAEEDDYAQRIASGEVIDDAYLPVLYGAAPEADWHDPKVWAAANPNLGVSVKLDFLEAQHREACEKPAYRNAFLRYHLNIRTEQSVLWMPMDRWDLCAGVISSAALAGQKCWVGLDLSRRNDITAAVSVFKDGARIIAVPRFYIPADGLEAREKRDKVPYRRWVELGLVTATPGNVIDYAFVRADVLALSKAHDVQEVAYDPYGATQLALQLQDDGITCVEFGQSIKHMSEPTKSLLLLVLSGDLVHGGNPVLRWMAANATAVHDANDNVKLAKNKSKGRIDGIVALIMGLSRATLHGDRASVYEQRGIVEL